MINEKLALVPSCPGCYLMKNSEGYIIYVGKSKNLKNRLSSYFKSSHTGKTKMLVSEIADFEYIITNTEIESLLLEINLIKKYDPKYNILLRDDKTYPYIELTNDIVPVLKVVRNPNVKKNKNSHIFGPYPNVKAARDVVEVINRLYPLRKCRTYQKKECLYYHIGECLGYCVHQIDDGTLKNMKNEIIAFFNGRDEILTDKIKSKMNIYSEKQEYEKALEYKKLLDNISIVLEKQKVELKDNLNRDVIGHYALNGYISITILFIRGGKLLDKTNQIFPIAISEEDSLNNYISMFYDHHKIKPNEVIVEDMVDNLLLRKLYGINFITPLKGLKKNILLLACDNAKNAYQEKMELIKRNDDQRLNAICELKEKLNVNSVSRIEIFDNSNLFGTYNVSGMVVFKDGLPLKNEYRKFKITNDVNDDYGTMKEVIYRRYFRLLKEKKQMPDLIIVDGGIGQINVAMEVIRDLNLDILVCGLKKDDKHNTSLLIDGRTKEIVDIDRKSPLFLLLTRMQDEVHNFTINYHQKLRSKGALSSVLDNVLGIGPLRKEKLLKKYRTISKMKMADIDELKTILPDKVAENFYNFLKEI
ncbi:MAG: excinuclease ABC subunit UvrC [Bacilli bacterium]|mgnify:FL=1